MESKDLKILRELDKNARQSISQISKKTRLSKDIISYRLNKLKKQNILTGSYALINGFCLGNTLYKILLKFQKVGKEKETALISWLKLRKEVIWIGSCDGQWNLIMTFHTQELSKLKKFIEELYSKFGNEFQNKQILISEEVMFFNEKYLYPDKKITYEKIMSIGESKQIDEKDKTILRELSKNARSQTIDISKKIKLSAEATAKRIRELIKKKIILGFKPRLNFSKLNLQYCHLYISTKNYPGLNKIINYYKNHIACISIMKYTGSYDLHLELVLKSNDELREVMLDFRDKFGDDIIEYNPLTIYKEHKFSPFP